MPRPRHTPGPARPAPPRQRRPPRPSGGRPLAARGDTRHLEKRHHDQHGQGQGSEPGQLERLQKVLATAGIGSRRACEELITAGRVEVDRVVVTQLGTRVDPRSQDIRVDGERLPRVRRVVYLLNKPVGVVTTNYDPAGRSRAVDLVPTDQRLFCVGRLDRTSEGLLLVTNDGDLANLLAHPRYGVEKKYLVQVAGVPAPDVLEQLRQGIRLAEGEVHAKRVTLRTQHKNSAVLEMVLDEGKNREIRRMLARLGHKVHQLKRVAVGGLSLGNLLPGQFRPLAWSEVETLRRDALAAVGTAPDRRSPGDRGAPRRRETPPRGSRSGSRGRGGGLGVGGVRPAQGRPTTHRSGKPRRPGKASTWRKLKGSKAPPGGVEE